MHATEATRAVDYDDSIHPCIEPIKSIAYSPIRIQVNIYPDLLLVLVYENVGDVHNKYSVVWIQRSHHVGTDIKRISSILQLKWEKPLHREWLDFFEKPKSHSMF